MCKKQKLPSLEDQIKKAEAKQTPPPKNSSDTSSEEPYLEKFGGNKPIPQDLER